MKEIKFDKKQEGNQLIIDVELPRRKLWSEPVLRFSNSEMIQYLKESGIKVEDYELSSQSKDYLTSYADKRNEPILDGTWVFTKKQKKVNKTKTRKMDLFSRLWMRAIQIKNGKGEGMIFFRDPHISRTWHFRDPHITRGF